MDEQNQNTGEDNSSTVNSAEDATKQAKQINETKDKINNNAAVQAAKKAIKEAVKNFILAHLPLIIGIIIALIVVIIFIGFIQAIIANPGLLNGYLQEFSSTFLGHFTGNNVTITKEQEKEVAQYIQDMGYDVTGYGFADAEYTEDSEETTDETEATGLENKEIEEIHELGNINYLRHYLTQNESIYSLTQWSWKGAFEALVNGGTPESYGTGMIHITQEGQELVENLWQLLTGGKNVYINRESKELRIRFSWSSLFNNAYMYFNMENWSSLYGKPLELFLALHISTMMPDLTYDLATEQCFNTKVNIDLQKVNIKWNINVSVTDPKTGASKTLNEQDIKRIYLIARWGLDPSSLGVDTDTFFDAVISFSKRVSYSSEKGVDLTEILAKINGTSIPKDEEHKWVPENSPEVMERHIKILWFISRTNG